LARAALDRLSGAGAGRALLRVDTGIDGRERAPRRLVLKPMWFVSEVQYSTV
jgi:hypothetical protein